jgi:hypothetical protein
MRIARWLVVGSALLVFSGGEATACPNCKEAVAAQPEEAGRMKDGYYYSILFMIGMPFSLLGTGAFFVARAVKRGALPPM